MKNALLRFAVAGLSSALFGISSARAQMEDNSYPHAADMRTMSQQAGRSTGPAASRPSDAQITSFCNDPKNVCLVTVNKSNYRVVSFRFSTENDSNGRPIWSPNLFAGGEGIYAHKATIWASRRDAVPCNFSIAIALSVNGRRVEYPAARFNTCTGFYNQAVITDPPRRGEVYVEDDTVEQQAADNRVLASAAVNPGSKNTAPQ